MFFHYSSPKNNLLTAFVLAYKAATSTPVSPLLHRVLKSDMPVYLKFHLAVDIYIAFKYGHPLLAMSFYNMQLMNVRTLPTFHISHDTRMTYI